MNYHRRITSIETLIGGVCLGYYAYLCIAYGFHYIVFSWVFGLMGLLFLLIAFIEQRKQRHIVSFLPILIRRIVIVLLSLGLVIFTGMEAVILYQGFHRDVKQGEAALILGAQLNGSTISRLLRYRLESGVQFAKEHPNAYLIVSGGQGSNEQRSEAAAMKEYLFANGVAKERILVEDRSMNTQENLAYSKDIMKMYHLASVSIITNDFHMFRARYIAAKQGITSYGYPARSDPDLAPNFFLREFFGSVKDILISNTSRIHEF